MKKASLCIVLVCLGFLVWTMSCQSPSSSGDPASYKASNKSQSNSNSSSGGAIGFIQLSIKDKPVDDAKNIFVTISNIRVHKACEDGENCFTTISEEPLTIDLLALQTTPLELPTASLPTGAYNQIRMAVTSGQIVFASTDPENPDDVFYDLNVPSDEIKSHLHFDLEANETVRITLDFDAKNSIHVIKKGHNNVYQLRPVVNVVEVTEVAGN
jgi:hypothetical protein